MAEGKRLCGACGQPISAVAAPAVPEPLALPEPTSHSCSHCGAALAPGKRFCKQCGKPVGESTLAAEPAPAALPQQADSPTTLSCAQCGAALAPGKRFCKQCGQSVDSNAAAAQVDPVPRRHDGIPAPQSTVFDLPAATLVAASTNKPEAAFPAQDGLPNDLTSDWGPAESGSQLPGALPAATASIAPTRPQPESPRESKPKLGLATGIAAAVLLTAGGVVAWHLYSHRGASPVAKSTPEPQQATVTPPTVIPLATITPLQAPKPTPSIQEHAVSSPPKSQSELGMVTTLSAPSTNTLRAPVQPRDVAIPQPAISPPRPSPPAPTYAEPGSGILHYQGPPVPYNGVVVFDHLPQARLKFVFNHQAWSLTLKPNPDGTKKATLISVVPGYQTSCDLGWETIE